MRKDVTRLDFIAACRRLDRYVADLAEAKGIEAHAIIRADSRPLENWPEVYKIQLRNGSAETALRVDYDTLTESDEFFFTFVVPQLEDAIEKLGAEHR
jgi:hypothetical protein